PHGQRRRAHRPRPQPRRGRPGRRGQGRRQARSGRADRADPRPAPGQRGTTRDRAHDRGDHAAAHLGERALQDHGGREAHGPPGRAVVTVLAGGTGGAKLARGMLDEVGPDELVVVANTADDTEVYGVHVSPDPDLVTYWLADLIDERGYGIAGDTWEVMRALESAGQPAWFRLGDRDLTMCLIRTALLRAGERPTDAHAAVVRAAGVTARVLPMSDEPVRTSIRAGGRWLPFQEFMIVDRAPAPSGGVGREGVARAQRAARSAAADR